MNLLRNQTDAFGCVSFRKYYVRLICLNKKVNAADVTSYKP